MVNSVRRNFVTLALVAVASASAAMAQDREQQPILLDAESSSFDQKNETVVFRSLNITQGDIGIRADEAVASALDFERSEWSFTGNVVITIESAKIEADTAELVFANHGLVTAELRGRPARFEDLSSTREEPISGSANILSYDNTTRVLQMSESARLSEGSNEMTGCNLIYDLNQEQITSGSSGCGEQVVITIVPPASDDDEPESPPSP
ncbi:MAG TPA: LptA/OstA family protein [Gammaproteobacteria bacterium]